MEKLNCNVVYDLLPLYLDGLCSEESKRMVEEHIESCVECRKALETMKQDITIPEDTDVEVIKKVKRRIWIEKIVVVFVVLFIVANILFIGGIHLLSDQVSMKDMITADNVYIEEDTNGDLWLVRGGNAVYASHVIQEQYTPDGRLIIGMEETEVEDYKGEKVIDVVLSESRISRITHQILGDTASIEEEKSLLFNMDEKTDRCKVVIKTADGEVVLWEKKVGIVCVLVVLIFGSIYIREEIKAGQTVADMATDTTHTVITGIWDSDNLDQYKYLAIPDDSVATLSNYGFVYDYKKVTDIGEAAFQGNVWIESVYIPIYIKKIQKNAFNGCSSVTSISYAGTEEQWKQIIIESGNDILNVIPVEYNATMPRTKDYEYKGVE